MARQVFLQVGQEVQEHMLQPLAAQGTPAERLARWTKGVARFYAKGDKNCLLGAMVLSGGSGLFAAEIEATFQALIDALTQAVQGAGIARAESKRRAENAVAQIQGSLIVSRGMQNPKHFQRVLRELPQALLAS